MLAVIYVVLFVLVSIPIIWTRLKREFVRLAAMERTMWDSRVDAWVQEGVNKGYCTRAGCHMAYDGRTKVHTLVVQTNAVKRLQGPEVEALYQREKEKHER